MMGRYVDALKAAQRVQDHVAPHAAKMPMLDGFMPLPTLVLVRFHRWDEIMKLPQPAANLPMSNGVWHYARALAFASNGNLPQAQNELAALRKLAPEMAKVPTNPQGPRNAGIIPQIAAHVIEARMAETRNDSVAAVNHLREAVALQDTMDYTEPPDWFYPVRESLGAALLTAGKAPDAEQVFRADLEKNPRNPRSLFGLMEALKAQGRAEDASAVRQQFDVAWKNSDTPLQVSDLLGGPIPQAPAATTAGVVK
jgi:predicted Zn-dependent protease